MTQAFQPSNSPATIPYAEYSFGFEMQLPGGWSFDRTRFAGPEGALGLLKGRATAERATLQVLVYRTTEAGAVERWMDGFARAVGGVREGKDGAGARVVKKSPRKIGTRDAVVIETDASDGPETKKTFYFGVPFDATTIWVLVLSGVMPPGGDAGPIRAQFDELAGSLRVLYEPTDQAEIAAALERGKLLLTKLRDAAPALELDSAPAYYEIRADGKAIGYLAREITRESRSLDDPRTGGNKKDGVRIRERSWRFDDDGSAAFSRVDLFASFDLRSELIESEQTRIPSPKAAVPAIVTTTDQCVREEDLLFSSMRSSLDQKLPEPREPIRVGIAYLGLAWTRLLPALLGTRAGETHAFAVYDSATRALITHVGKALGPRALPAASPAQEAYAYEVREAFAAKPTLVFADAHGDVQRVEAGELIILRSSEKRVEQLFGERRDAALARTKRGR